MKNKTSQQEILLLENDENSMGILMGFIKPLVGRMCYKAGIGDFPLINLYKRSTSSLMHNCVPEFIVAAVPQATPYWTASISGFFASRLITIPATILSPAPTVDFLCTGGGTICSARSFVTSIAPVCPMDTTIASHVPVPMISIARSSMDSICKTSFPARELSSPRLGLIRYTPSCTACFNASPEVSTINRAFFFLAIHAIRAYTVSYTHL